MARMARMTVELCHTVCSGEQHTPAFADSQIPYCTYSLGRGVEHGTGRKKTLAATSRPAKTCQDINYGHQRRLCLAITGSKSKVWNAGRTGG